MIDFCFSATLRTKWRLFRRYTQTARKKSCQQEKRRSNNNDTNEEDDCNNHYNNHNYYDNGIFVVRFVYVNCIK